MSEERKIAIVGASDLAPEIARQLFDYAKEHNLEVVVVGSDNYDLIRAHRSIEDELRLLDSSIICPRMAPDLYVLSAMQEEIEWEFIESCRFNVTFIAAPNSDGVTWFKQKYPRALVYSWQQAQDINFDARLAVSR
jgi:hypothetical protein